MTLETILATTLLPAGIDLIKSLFGGIGRKIGGVSVDDQIKLEESGVNRLKAVAELDNPYGAPSQWVVDLRASFRYVAAGALILAGMGIAAYGASLKDATIFAAGLETAGSPFFFIFGERMWVGLKGNFK
jgi:hypothetical protein